MKRQLLLTLILLVVFITSGLASELVIDFLDVGQGDAILVRTSAGGVMLIDGGVESAGREVVVPFLKNAGVNEIDLLIMTHPHSDHIGGLIPVLNEFPVKRIYADAQIHTTQVYERLLLLIEEKNVPFYRAKAGMELELAGVDQLLIIHPQDQFLAGLNNNSVVLKMTFGDFTSLFTGDIERLAEELLITSDFLLGADLLKVAHHGSNTSSISDFVTAVNPSIAVIMLEEDNRYNHPGLETLVNLGLVGSEIYRTDIHGTVTVRVTEDLLEVTSAYQHSNSDPRINLALATSSQLQTIPGIGPVLAERIIEYRQQFGFTELEQLLNIQGIGNQTFEKIIDYLYLN